MVVGVTAVARIVAITFTNYRTEDNEANQRNHDAEGAALAFLFGSDEFGFTFRTHLNCLRVLSTCFLFALVVNTEGFATGMISAEGFTRAMTNGLEIALSALLLGDTVLVHLHNDWSGHHTRLHRLHRGHHARLERLHRYHSRLHHTGLLHHSRLHHSGLLHHIRVRLHHRHLVLDHAWCRLHWFVVHCLIASACWLPLARKVNVSFFLTILLNNEPFVKSSIHAKTRNLNGSISHQVAIVHQSHMEIITNVFNIESKGLIELGFLSAILRYFSLMTFHSVLNLHIGFHRGEHVLICLNTSLYNCNEELSWSCHVNEVFKKIII